MEFTLHYQGILKSNGRPADKHQIRKVFHIQLKNLWNQLPLCNYKHLLNGKNSVVRRIDSFDFAPLVSEKIHLAAEIKIIMLRPEPPGSIITQGGDIDNRLKTLLDSLKVPSEPNALPKDAAPNPDENPFFCVLEDDNLITKISVETDRLLTTIIDPLEVILLLHIKTIRLADLIATSGL